MIDSSTVFIFSLGVLLFALGRQALLCGLIASSVFQALAFINFGTSPIIAYYFFGIFFILRAVLDLFINPKDWFIPGHNNPPIYLLGFGLVALIGAFLLPQLFYGMLIYSPKLSIDEQFNNMTQLSLGPQHLNQSVQLFVNILVFLIIWLTRTPPTIFIKSIFFTFYFTIIVAVWQVMANALGIYFPKEFLYTVKGWMLGNEQLIGSFSRVNSSFLEPSVFATYLVGIFGFLLVWYLRCPSKLIVFSLMLAILALLVTTSTTAYMGLILVLTILVGGLGLIQFVNGGWINKTILYILLAVIGIGWLALITAASFNEVRDLVGVVLLEKMEGDSFRFRFEADIQSIDILLQTYGLGVGLGSNRPSSFFTFLFSNLGIIGFTLFIVFLISLTRLALIRAAYSNEPAMFNWALAASSGLWATILAKFIAQPDLSFSPMWIWLFFLGSICVVKPDAVVQKELAPGLIPKTSPQ